jgi:release factor glutamine methyltransferase
MLTILEVLKRTTEFFEEKGIGNAKLNAELILAHGLGLPKRMDLYLQFDRPLEESELDGIRPLVKRRGSREPIQYIESRVDFMGVDFKVDSRVLIPRPETEELVERTGDWLQDFPPRRILDLGTGCGVIALSLARMFPESGILATDVSADALALAQENAAAQGLAERVQFLEADWFSGVVGTFDLIVSNPPYLAQAEFDQAESEVRNHEPHEALVSSGANGEGCLLAILSGAVTVLNDSGLLAMETGISQREILESKAVALGYAEFLQEADLSGRDRFFFAKKG